MCSTRIVSVVRACPTTCQGCQGRLIYFDLQCTVTPKTLSILTSMVVRAAHHQTPWESRLALLELNVEDTLGYKIAPWVM